MPAQPPAIRTVPPVAETPDAHLPTLALEMQLSAYRVVVSETATLTLTVSNVGADGADDLVVTLPMPDDVHALPGGGWLGPNQGWRWSVGHLDAGDSTALVASFRVARMPDGPAVLFAPEATARGLGLPVIGQAGAIRTS